MGALLLLAEPAAARSIFDNPGVSVSLALALGMLLQCVARHLRVPALLLLLAAGVLLGPDGLDVIRPSTLGPGLQTLVGFAVAVILFEGGLNLDLKRLRRESSAIRALITIGALVTTAGAALAARFFMGWDWSVSILFGTLVIVTGPTVIGPLLKRVKVQRSVSTVLEAEGVLIDAVGAITAAVALEVVLSADETWLRGSWHMVQRLGFGTLLGLGGGIIIGWLLRRRDWIPEGLENVFVLSLCLALFQISNSIQHESGIAAVTVAGLVVGNMRSRVQRELVEFKEQLTVLFIGMLFVLLAADVRVDSVLGLGWGALGVVAALVFVVRPLNVLASTWRSELNIRQKAFLAWIAPRGIVAAAVASLFARDLTGSDGTQLRALVFLVIAITVLLAGLTGAPLANWLGLRRPTQNGWVILGANELARQLARILAGGGQEVVLLDTNADAARAAEADKLRVIFGNGLEERTLQRAEIETRAGVIGLSPNDELNQLFVQTAKRHAKVPRLLVSRRAEERSHLLEEIGAEILFGRSHDLQLWCVRLRRRTAVLEEWEYAPPSKQPKSTESAAKSEISKEVAATTEEVVHAVAEEEASRAKGPEPSTTPADSIAVDTPKPLPDAESAKAPPTPTGDPLGVRRGPQLALAVERGGKRYPLGDRTKLAEGDRVFVLVYEEKREEVREALLEHGWKKLDEVEEKPIQAVT